MKKIFMTIPCLAGALTVFSAMAVEVKPFIGGNLAINGVVYSDEVEEIFDDIGVDLPGGFFGLGIEAGVRFLTDDIYNASVALAYDYAFDSEADVNSVTKDYISSIDTGFSAISATFDNYIRVSGDAKQRQDVVLGIGLGRATERIKMKATTLGKANGLYNINEDDDGSVVVLKIGYNNQISERADWYLNGRWFIPTVSDSDVEVMFNLGAGIKFVF